MILVADALKRTAEKIGGNVFIGRYGGDEFTVIIQTGEKGLMEQMAASLTEAVHLKKKENKLEYNLEISIGYDWLRGPSDTTEACFRRADEKLYENKRSGRKNG